MKERFHKCCHRTLQSYCYSTVQTTKSPFCLLVCFSLLSHSATGYKLSVLLFVSSCVPVSLPRLSDFDWRVDIKTSSDTLARMSVPTCVLQLKVWTNSRTKTRSSVIVVSWLFSVKRYFFHIIRPKGNRR